MRLKSKMKSAKYRLETLLRDIQNEVFWLVKGKRWPDCDFEQQLNGHTWCFVVGCNNSGTSILQNMLGKHVDVSVMPLEGQMHTKTFPRAKKKGHERVWSEYQDELINMPSLNDNVLKRLVFDWIHALPCMSSKVIVEKTPSNLLRMDWLQEAFPQAHFIGIVRNGYAVCEGIKRKGNKNFERAALHWNCVNKLLIENSKRMKHYLEISYENLCDFPEETAVKIASFLDIDPVQVITAVQSNFNFQTIAGKDSSKIVNLNRKSFDRLTSRDVAVINANASEMLKYFGYFIEDDH